MSKNYPSIFNEILGPVMVGPSSSHTCGPARIGYLCNLLAGGKVRKATVIFASGGSYPNTYKGQRSDMGFTGGLLGIREYDPRIASAFDEAKRAGVSVEFVVEECTPPTPNFVIIRICCEDGEHIEVQADSTGGGTLKIMQIDGLDVSITGDAYELLAFSGSDEVGSIAAAVGKLYPESERMDTAVADTRGVVNVKLRSLPSGEEISLLRSLKGVEKIVALEPVHPVLSNTGATIPFHSAEELLRGVGEGTGLGEMGVRYEMARAGWEQREVEERMDYVIDVMERGAHSALAGKVRGHGILAPSSASVNTSAVSLDLGILNIAVPWAMGVMECNSDMGVVVAGPTGGSAGVIPGALLAPSERMGLDRKQKRLALFAAGMTGVIIAARGCNFSAEMFGCQIEVGASSALAASGLVEIMGGTARQALDAAATATHNILGLICDPVAGLVELPCISRNGMGVANAAVSANMVLGGYSPHIGMDESAEVLIKVGRELPAKFRCTGTGGLCDCATGRRLFDEQQVRNNQR